MSTNATQGIKKVVLEATVTRAATGEVENLGPIAEYNSDPKKQSKFIGKINVKNPFLYYRYLASKGRI